MAQTFDAGEGNGGRITKAKRRPSMAPRSRDLLSFHVWKPARESDSHSSRTLALFSLFSRKTTIATQEKEKRNGRRVASLANVLVQSSVTVPTVTREIR